MTRSFLSILTVFLVAAGAYAETEGHIFTDPKGRTLQATIIRFDEAHNKVTIKPEHRGATTVPITVFSKADQNYIIQWSKNQAFLNKRKLSVDFHRMKEKNTGKSSEGYDIAMKVYNNYFKIDFDNESDVDFKNMTVEYVMFYTQDHWTDHNNAKKSVDGTKYVKTTLTLSSRSKQEIETEKIPLKQYRESGYGDIWASLNGEMKGILVKLTIKTKDGEPITRTLRYPDGLQKSWTTKSVDAATGNNLTIM